MKLNQGFSIVSLWSFFFSFMPVLQFFKLEVSVKDSTTNELSKVVAIGLIQSIKGQKNPKHLCFQASRWRKTLPHRAEFFFFHCASVRPKGCLAGSRFVWWPEHLHRPWQIKFSTMYIHVLVRWGTHVYMSLFPSVCLSVVHHILGTVHHLQVFFFIFFFILIF